MACSFFFFFKQKTAYEITTGDWSSDVCSSDLDGLSAGRSVVHRVGVDVHPDEPINASWVEAAAVRRRVREGLGAVREAVLNAGLEVAGDVPHQRVSQVATHDVAAERQRQARLVVPPFAEIDPEVQPAVRVRQLALVD